MKEIIDKRFGFGKNWARFLTYLNEARILEAEKSLQEKLGVATLEGKIFLDIGSGSGVFSLAAHRLGATVYSFDYDKDSVGCTQYLKNQYGKSLPSWTVEQGSVLDTEFLKRFDQADVVYSWGVLHHTGNMYQAFENVAPLVKQNGRLFISIYNDQGGASQRWLWMKRQYNSSGAVRRLIFTIYTMFRQWTLTFVKDTLKSGNPLRSWWAYGQNNRGMSAWHDVVDWAGGYPFEVAKPEEVFDCFKSKGFELDRIKTCAGGVGCNEFVFVKK